jgi:tetratricopeptide (TPR) repeat protein
MLYDTRGWLHDGLDMLGRAVIALEASRERTLPDRTDQVALGHLLTTRALLAYRLAQHEQAQAMLERSLEILRPLNELRVMVESLTFLGVVMLLTGNYARAAELFDEGLEKATAVGDQWFSAMCLSEQVNVALMIGKTENAHERMQSAVASWRAIGDPRFTAFGLNLLSQSALGLGLYDEARAALEESVALNSSVGARWNLGSAYQGLGSVAQAQGEHLQAVDMFRKGVDTFAELGARQFVAQGLAEMGQSLLVLGNHVEAERIWRESLLIATETHGTPVALAALVGLANLQTRQGDLEHALELVLVALSHAASTQDTKNRAAELRVELESHLTAQQIQAVQAQAEGESYEQIVSQVLRKPGPSGVGLREFPLH